MTGQQITLTTRTYTGSHARTYTVIEYDDLTAKDPIVASDWERRGWKAMAKVRGKRGATKYVLQAINDGTWHEI